MIPTAKVTAGLLAGALTTVLLFLLKKYGYDVTLEVQGALQTLFVFGVQYVVPDRTTEG
jgi:hypothetical protein